MPLGKGIILASFVLIINAQVRQVRRSSRKCHLLQMYIYIG